VQTQVFPRVYSIFPVPKPHVASIRVQDAVHFPNHLYVGLILDCRGNNLLTRLSWVHQIDEVKLSFFIVNLPDIPRAMSLILRLGLVYNDSIAMIRPTTKHGKYLNNNAYMVLIFSMTDLTKEDIEWQAIKDVCFEESQLQHLLEKMLQPDLCDVFIFLSVGFIDRNIVATGRRNWSHWVYDQINTPEATQEPTQEPTTQEPTTQEPTQKRRRLDETGLWSSPTTQEPTTLTMRAYSPQAIIDHQRTRLIFSPHHRIPRRKSPNRKRDRKAWSEIPQQQRVIPQRLELPLTQVQQGVSKNNKNNYTKFFLSFLI